MPERRFPLCATLFPLLFSLLFSVAVLSAQEAPEIGAPRVLRLVDFQGRPLLGSFSEVAWETRGDGLFFTLENRGARNIWRAFPDPQDTSRFPAWKALPITDFNAPKFASNPVPLPGDRMLVCVSNATSKNPQICRYDIRIPGFTAIARDDSTQSDPVLSPDGRLIAFTQEKGGASSVWGIGSQGGEPFLLSNQARRAAWHGRNQLIFESLASGARGLYTRDLNASQAKLLIGGGGEVGAVPARQNEAGSGGLFFSARPDAASPPRLYWLSSDGSGLRALGGTEGARRPSVSRDGRLLAYDAPLLTGVFASASDEPARSLWVVPLAIGQKNNPLAQDSRWVKSPSVETPRNSMISNADISSASREASQRLKRDTPRQPIVLSAQLRDVSALRGAVYSPGEVGQARGSFSVRGTIRGEADLNVTLEAGEGQSPTVWTKIPVSQTPVSNDTLAIWTPTRARGVWTLRLTVFSRGGAAQNMLRVQLPLAGMPSPAIASTAEPVRSSTVKSTTVKNVGMIPQGALPPLPLPPPAPIPGLPSYPGPTVGPTASPTPRPTPPAPVRAPRPAPTPSKIQDFPPPTTFVANFNVSGTLARVAANQKFKVTFWGQNIGTANWQTGGNGADRVRVVARWVDFSTGTRRKWNFYWLKSPVVAGNRTKFEFELTPPARPGKYKLIYGLVRLPANGDYMAPPYSSPQEAWPGEFGAIAFAVEVVAPKGEVTGEEPSTP